MLLQSACLLPSKGFIPGFPDVLKVKGAGLHRRDFPDISFCPPRKNGARSVYSCVAEPRLGGRNQPAGDQCALVPCKFPYAIFPVFVPRKGRAPGR